MIPSHLAAEVRESLKKFVKNEFPVASPFFKNQGGNIIDAFLREENAIVKGPWVNVFLPFRVPKTRDYRLDEKLPYFRSLTMAAIGTKFKPYAHQIEAFERLSGDKPSSTIVATGTGSGKTECFLLPILDYCCTVQTKGVKAILIYPMNALASDQASRLAKAIKRIKDAVGIEIRAGLYTGDNPTDDRDMSDEGLITSRDALRKNPPDILLTNYKMLDYLTMRSDDQALWDKPKEGALKFIVVDELHTFDGAQGTDLSCLIRRLRERTGKTGAEDLACVGTSATIGGKEGLKALCDFASLVFAAPIDEDAVVLEERLSPDEFIQSELSGLQDKSPVGSFPTRIPDPAQSDSGLTFLKATIRAWFSGAMNSVLNTYDQKDDSVIKEALSKMLPRLRAFQLFVKETKEITEIRELAEQWLEKYPDELRVSGRTKEEKIAAVEGIINSLIGLIAEARKDGRPYLQIRTQLWARELARMVTTVNHKPRLLHSDDMTEKDLFALPLVVCRECAHAGWTSFINPESLRLSSDLQAIYRTWFGMNSSVRIFYPVTEEKFFEEHKSEIYLLDPVERKVISAVNQEWEDIQPALSKRQTSFESEISVTPIPVWIPQTNVTETRAPGVFSAALGEKSEVKVFRNACPFCQTRGSLVIFGSTTASMASAGVARINSSQFSGDPKIIAFSDSVQDASQRAGYFEARGYRNTVRHAIASYLRTECGISVSISQLLSELAGYWFNKGTYDIVISEAELLQKRAGDADQLEQKSIYKAYWSEACVDKVRILKEAAFVATFMPEDKQFWKEWSIFSNAADTGPTELIRTYEDWKALFSLSSERLVWSALEELGQGSEWGRSLNRSGLISVSIDQYKLNDAARSFCDFFYDKDSPIDLTQRDPSDIEKQCSRFLLSILNRIRCGGGFDAEVLQGCNCPEILKTYTKYIQTREAFAAFGRSPYLPIRGPRLPPPTGVVLRAAGEKFWPSLIPKSGGSWYKDRAVKFLQELLISPDNELQLTYEFYKDAHYIEKFWERAVSALAEAEIVHSYAAQDKVQCVTLDPNAFFVSQSVSAVQCGRCGKIHRVGATEINVWNDMPCLSNDCDGHFQAASFKADSALYSGDLVRINAREHTGLLKGKVRTDVERSFKSVAYPWSVNLISATPTLEMGVDIGDLSTVLQCSLPPTLANYLQRIGRAGRRDGNALALTMIGRDNHSLYYWSDPYLMLRDSVTVPGIFLQAVSVLERQLFAFALGRWVRTLAKSKKLSNNLDDAVLALKREDKEKFPIAFFEWTKNEEQQGELSDAFFSLFNDRPHLLTDRLKEELRRFLREDIPLSSSTKAFFEEANQKGPSIGMFSRVRKILEEALRSKESWSAKITELNRKIKEKKKEPKDESRDELIRTLQLSAKEYQKLIETEITRKDLYSALTDGGILPNFAFPEEGVQVRSVLLETKGGKVPDGESKYETEEESFTRSSAAAIGELTPPNLFYAYGHRFKIDEIAVDEDAFERWRICPSCGHAEKISKTELSSTQNKCPVCGSRSWADVGSVQTLMRMREMTLRADSRTDRITESDDRRKMTPSHKVLLIEQKASSLKERWTVKKRDLAFEIEYYDSVWVRELNLGPKSEDTGIKRKMAGKETSSEGFTICQSCGKFYNPDPKVRHKHDITCPYFGQDKDDENDPVWKKSLLLYRELASEAIRIRLPVFDTLGKLEANVATVSMIAAINLGLRKYFKGNIAHLRTDVQVLPDAEDGSIRYLVIYDTVPGGTGYLKELSRKDPKSGCPEVLLKVFRAALDAVSGCTCAQDPAKDGCYKCLFQFSNASQRKQISRKAAEEMLKKLVALSPDAYVPQEKPQPGTPSVQAIRESKESELEFLFRKRLSSLKGFSLKPTSSHNNFPAYKFEIKLTPEEAKSWTEHTGRQQDDTLLWRIDTQKHTEGARHESCVDFVFSPASRDLAKQNPGLIANVFTDGWKFHKPIINQDVLNRQSLINRRERVWSLAWDDFNVQNEEEKIARKDNRALLSLPEGLTKQELLETWDMALKRSGAGAKGAKDRYTAVESLLKKNETSFDLLVKWLRDPFSFSEKALDFVQFKFYGSFLEGKQNGIRAGAVTDNRVGSFKDLAEVTDPKNFKYLRTAITEQNDKIEEDYFLAKDDSGAYSEYSCAVKLAFQKSSEDSEGIDEADKITKEDWEHFLDLANLLQFSSLLTIATNDTLDDNVYDEIVVDNASTDHSQSWRQLQAVMTDPEFQDDLDDILDHLMELKVPYPSEVEAESWDRKGRDLPPLGLIWRTGSRTLAVFPSVQELEGFVSDDPNLVVVTNKMPNWLDQVKQFFGKE